MPTTASSPLPFLPLEVKGHILSFCDQSTLAVSSLVSLAFLELSIPILHDDIHIEGLENLEKLFCSRTGPASAVDECLALRGVRCLTIISTEPSGPYPDLHQDRVPDSLERLPIQHLTVGVHRLPEDDFDTDARWSPLLSLLDPIHALFQAFPAAPVPQLGYALVSLSRGPEPEWDRLRSLEFKDCTVDDHLPAIDLTVHKHADSEIIPLIIVYDLRSCTGTCDLDEDIDSCEDAMSDLGVDGDCGLLFGRGSRVNEAVVRFQSSAQKANFELMLALRMEPLSAACRSEILSKIRYDVTDSSASNAPSQS